MDSDELRSIVLSNSKSIAAGQNDLAELRQILKGTLSGVQALSTLKAGDAGKLAELEQRVARMEGDVSDVKALAQEIKCLLQESR